MKIVGIYPNPSGAYPPIQEGRFITVPTGTAIWPDELDAADFYAHSGFVALTIEQVDGVPTVTAYTPDVEAWETWKASLPQETDRVTEPTPQDDTDSMLVDHEYRLTLLELGVTE